MSNDPVVIVDGIRVNSAQTENSANLAADKQGTDQLVSSPLDAIDPNSIETVEVFKGPSAVALYGTDAVNGVIVVTTKRGQAGATRWSADGIWGQTTMPGTWPTNYMRFGTSSLGNVTDCSGFRESQSPFLGVGCLGANGGLLEYQLLNDPKTTVFGTGHKQTYRTTVSGGIRGFVYSFSGSLNEEIGILKMPDADVQVLQDSGIGVPSWQRRPQGSESQSGTVKISTDLGKADAEFTSTLTRSSSRTTPLQRAISVASGLYPAEIDLTEFGFTTNPWSATGSGVLKDIPNFRAKTSSQQVTTRNSLRVFVTPSRWLRAEAIAGVDFLNGKDLNTLGRGECSELFGGKCTYSVVGNGGEYNTGARSEMISTLSFRTSSPSILLGRWISVRPSVNGDYTRRTTNRIVRKASGLPAGATSGNGAEKQDMSEASDDRSTAGAFVESVLGFADRLYLPLSLRLDAGSGLGATVRPKYPRISPSFLISDIQAFRRIPVVGRLETVRLRTAYGMSGVQPKISEKLRTYKQVASIVDGVSVMSVEINSFGNSLLRPERTSEFEGGADIEMGHGRFSVNITSYRKRTIDALVAIDVPNSVNGGGTQLRNVGTVQNTGTEITVNATLLQQRSTLWQVNIGMSRNRNKLLKLGRDSLLGGSSGGVRTQFVEGYPLYGQWALPVTGFADLNGDGWITTGVTGGMNEVQLGTTPVYLGAPYPGFESSLHSTLTLLRDISVGITFNYQHGLAQKNEMANTTSSIGLNNRRAFNDLTTPLATQAYLAVACRVGLYFPNCSDIGIVQTVSTLRLNALSVGYILPRSLTSYALGGRTVRIALQGANLGLWTNYTGKDPNVNSSMSEVVRDAGTLPTSRVWQMTVGVN